MPPAALWSRRAPAGATLINNAALITEPQPLAEVDGAALSAAVRVGLEAPLLLTSAFLRATRAWPAPRRVRSRA